MRDEPKNGDGRGDEEPLEEAGAEGIVEELIDDILPERLDWRRLVRDHPIPSLLVVAAGGYYLGRKHGSAVLASLSGIAATEVGKRVSLFTDPEPEPR